MRLLVIRTSAMGDVALTTPVLLGMRRQYPDIEMILLTRSGYKAFFSSVEGLHLIFPDLKGRHNGFSGLIRLFMDINKEAKIDCVIDLHNVLRSKILTQLFRLSGMPVFVINKGRGAKKSVTTGKNKTQLKHTVERYCDVFEEAGFHIIPEKNQSICPSQKAIDRAASMVGTGDVLNIGVAPYAKHKLKMWPEENMIALLGSIAKNYKSRFWLFGGNEEAERLAAFQTKIPDSFLLPDKLTLDEELALMSRLDFMIAMDSSNMHMAALVGTKVVSIWGGTDPLIGFGAWMQPDNYSVRIPVDELTCRPCTVFGSGQCARGDFACMNWLTPEIVYRKIDKLVFSDSSK